MVLSPTDYMAPNFAIEVAGSDVGSGVSSLVQRLEYESADGLADLIRIVLKNKDFILTDKRIFQPGNEIAVWFGYGNVLSYVGRGIINRPRPTFPRSDMPTLTVEAYSKDFLMSSSEPEASTDRTYKSSTYADAVKKVASRLNMKPDVDDTKGTKSFFQKAGMSDYQFVKALSNLAGFYFWVDADESGQWTLHFRDPAKNPKLQDKKYTFRYNDGDNSTLLDVDPEQAISGAVTKIKVEYRSPRGGLIEKEIEVKDKPSETGYKGDVEQDISEPPSSAEAVRLYMGEYAFQVVPLKRFADPAEAEAWAEQWFRKTRENFIMASGTVIGLETLRARQVHALRNIGTAYDGDYYFTNVRHVFDSGQGYTCSFNARKVI